MDDDNLENSLEEMRQEGTLEGKGRFTVNVAKAGSSLREFLLENPRCYVLNVFAHAIAAGATELEIFKDMDDFILQHNGRPLSAEELESLPLASVDESRTTPARELSIALSGAQALKPKWITIESGGQRLSLRDGQSSLESIPEVSSLTKIHVKESLSIKDFFKGRSEEARLLTSRCSYAPVTMTLNKDNLRRSWLPQQGLIAELLPTDGLPELDRIKQGFELPILESESREIAGLIYFERSGARPATELTVVLNGVSFQAPMDLGWPGSGAVIFCSHLHKDISQSGLVEDGAFLNLAKFIKQRLENLAIQAAQEWQALSSHTQEKRWDIIQRTDRSYELAEQWAEAVDTRRKMLNSYLRSKGHDHPETRAHRQRLASALVKNGQKEEATQLLLDEADAAKEQGYFQEQLNLLTTVRELLDQDFQLPSAQSVQLWSGLALAQARTGFNQESQQSVETLTELLGSGPQAEETLKRLQLVMDVLSTETRPAAAVCPACGGTRLMKDCPLVGREGAHIHVRVGEPTSLWLKSELDAPLLARVCADCGNVSLQVDKPEKLWSLKHRPR